MALSGSFYTSGYTTDSGDLVRLLFSWTATQSVSDNTTTISWKLTGNRNKTAYIKAGGFKVTIDGETVYSKSTDYRIELYNGTLVASGTKVLTHNNDGTRTFNVTAEGGIYYYAVNCTGSATFTLNTIARASIISSASNVTLGNACNVMWTPRSAAFRYKLKFSLGDWSHTTGALHPNKTSAYTYSGYEIPLEVAEQIPNAKTGIMTVTLYTYSDSKASARVGEADSATFTVTVPDSNDTQPTVTMTLETVNDLSDSFDGLYIQGKSKVKATLSATGQYEASITSYSMKADGTTYDEDEDLTSDYLSNSGSITVYGYAKDSRGITGSTSKKITVIGYSKPQVIAASGESDVVAARCDSDGNLNDSGTYLKIKAKRRYSKVASGGEQYNYCALRYRYKLEGASSYSSWTTILARDSIDSDEIVTGALLGGVLATASTYLVQVQAIDDVGEYGYTTITVPTDKVYMHRDKAKRAMAFGKYIEEENCVDIAEDISVKSRGPFYAQGGGNIDCLIRGSKLTATADAPLDLDNFKTPGNYYSPNAENSQNIANTPYADGGFGLTVRELQTADFIRQELIYGRNTWNRHFDGTSWSNWWRYQATTVPETASVDYVVETGVSDGWTYRKWKGGSYEMFGTFEVTPPASTQRDTMYRTDNMTIELPFTITSAYISGTAVGHYWLTNAGKSGDSAITLRLMGTREFDTTTPIEVRLMVMGTYT